MKAAFATSMQLSLSKSPARTLLFSVAMLFLACDGTGTVILELGEEVCVGVVSESFCVEETLVVCANGREVEREYCEFGCIPEPQAACVSWNPCEGLHDGAYCGGEVGLEEDWLFWCQNERQIGSELCQLGCQDGACLLPDPCLSATEDGWYCHDDLATGDRNTSYHCVGGSTAASELCEYGCESGECIIPDPCLAATSDGWFCSDTLGEDDPDTRYQCEGGLTVDSEYCDYGCEAGHCIPPDPCVATEHGNGWYCEESLGLGELDTRYRCVDGETADSEYCEYGCSRQPPGQHDICAPSPDGFYLPLECGYTARISQGNHGTYSHTGMSAYAFDFAIPRDTTVVAIRAGTVRRLKDDIEPGHPCYDGGGSECSNQANYVILSHDDGTDSGYAHLNSVSVSVGESVATGQHIAYSGNTGYSTGPHLHMQRQERCSSWWCQSIPLSFEDWPHNGGVPVTGDYVTSGNCF